MSEETLKRIEEDADKYGFQIPYDGTQEFYDPSKAIGYIAGAISERNKVIDEIQMGVQASDPYYSYLESLKIPTK